MFERYTEKARRVIFFARYEASQFGSPYIESEHLLLGILREARTLVHQHLGERVFGHDIRAQIAACTTVREKVPTSVDLPLSNECERILAYAAEEAERLGHKFIGCEHLLLGILREKSCLAETLLAERGVKLTHLREELSRGTIEDSPLVVPPLTEPPLPRNLLERITQTATSAIIFAMYEASRARSHAVETEHLLLGLVHEDKATVDLLLGVEISEESIRKQIEANDQNDDRPPMNLANMPLSDQGKRALTFAAHIVARSGQHAIATGHILMGLLRDRECFAAQMIVESGADVVGIWKKISEAPTTG
jgi:ATP-dependent Clp protease ATP-binding subunit ClpA